MQTISITDLFPHSLAACLSIVPFLLFSVGFINLTDILDRLYFRARAKTYTFESRDEDFNKKRMRIQIWKLEKENGKKMGEKYLKNN